MTWPSDEADGARGGGAGEARRLGRRPDFEPVAGQPRGRGQRLDRRATGRGRPRSGRRSRLAPANVAADVAGLDDPARRRPNRARAASAAAMPALVRQAGGKFVARLQRVERLGRRPPIGRGDRDPVGIFDHGERAGNAHRRRPGRSPTRRLPGGRAAHRGEDHVGQPHVAGEQRRPVDLGRHVEPRQRLAGQPVARARRGPAGSSGSSSSAAASASSAKAMPVAAAPDEAVMRVELLPIRVPARAPRPC